MGISSPPVIAPPPGTDPYGVPVSADTHVRLTPLADRLIARGGGRLASDAARNARRVGMAMGDRTSMRLGELLSVCPLDAPDLAELVQGGVLEMLEADPAAGGCERCNAPATPGTTLCQPCRQYLGWAALAGQPAPPPPPIVVPQQLAPILRRRDRGSGMHVNRRR